MRVRYRRSSRITCLLVALAPLHMMAAAARIPPPAELDDLLRDSRATSWRTCAGEWTVAGGTAKITEGSPEGLIIHRAYRPATMPLAIEVSVSGSGATVLFGLDDTVDATVGHYVRVAGGTLETGLIRGATADELTGRTALPPPRNGWTTLEINIDPSARTYDILANGARALETQELVCPGGWIGLRSADASASFRTLAVRQQPKSDASSPQARELSVHRLRYVRAGAGNLVVYDPERNLLLAMDLRGKVLKSVPPRFPVRATTEVSAGGRAYRISDGRLLVSRGGSSSSDAAPDTIQGPIAHAVAIVADRDGSVYVTDAGSPAVHQVDATGKVVRTWRANLLGGFIAPHGIDLLGTNELVVADYDRVVILTKGKDEESAEITSGAKSIVVEWTLPAAVAPFAEVSEDGSSWRRVAGENGAASSDARKADGKSMSGKGAGRGNAATGKARVVIGNLEPATTYLLRFGPVVKTIPASAGVSRVLEASTLSRDPASAEAR